jgi:hypothetical protein
MLSDTAPTFMNQPEVSAADITPYWI